MAWLHQVKRGRVQLVLNSVSYISSCSWTPSSIIGEYNFLLISSRRLIVSEIGRVSTERSGSATGIKCGGLVFVQRLLHQASPLWMDYYFP